LLAALVHLAWQLPSLEYGSQEFQNVQGISAGSASSKILVAKSKEGKLNNKRGRPKGNFFGTIEVMM
jgi:hypothetical protein